MMIMHLNLIKEGYWNNKCYCEYCPKLCSDFQKLSISKNQDEINEAEKLDKILQPVHSAMFIESNPSPVKYAAKLMNLCDDAVRLPLVKTSENSQPVIKKALESRKIDLMNKKPILV